MGTTWIGENLRTGELIVAKEPKITGQVRTDQLNIEKLKIEADILRVLNHKGITKFLDYVTVKNSPVLLTSFVKGDLLEVIAAREPQDEKLAVRHISDLLDAVGYIHSLNIIHRDIRPKNILLDPDRNNLTLIDFGTAKFFHHQLVTPEAIISPGGYSPPEHYKLGYSPQGDLWSVGGTLFYVLTGQHPVLVLGAYPQNSQPADPRRLRPNISDRISQVVIKATQLDPARRFLNAVEMKQVLEGSSLKTRTKPVVSVRNSEIPIPTPRILIGRNEHFDSLFEDETTGESTAGLAVLEEKPSVEVSSDKTVIKIVDPGSYISRLHAEIFESNGTWFLKDLGSLNGTAILGDSGWQPIHSGHKQEGRPYPLSGNDIISLGYSSLRGPYLVLTFLVA